MTDLYAIHQGLTPDASIGRLSFVTVAATPDKEKGDEQEMVDPFRVGTLPEEPRALCVQGLSREQTREGTACVIHIEQSLTLVRDLLILSVEYDDILDVAHFVLGYGDTACCTLSFDVDKERNTLLWQALNEGGVYLGSVSEPEFIIKLPIGSQGAFASGTAVRRFLREHRSRLIRQAQA